MDTLCDCCNIKSSAAKFLSKKELEKLNNNCVQVTFLAGEIIFKQDAFSSNIIYVKEGLVKIHIKGPHNDQIIKITKAPSYLGICFIDNEVFKQFIINNGEFAYELVIELCHNELNSFQRCVNRTQKHINGRIADALMFFKNTFENNEFILPFTRLEFGNFVDTSRESVSRILTEFKNDGIINLDGKKVKILNEKLLETISKKG